MKCPLAAAIVVLLAPVEGSAQTPFMACAVPAIEAMDDGRSASDVAAGVVEYCRGRIRPREHCGTSCMQVVIDRLKEGLIADVLAYRAARRATSR